MHFTSDTFRLLFNLTIRSAVLAAIASSLVAQQPLQQIQQSGTVSKRILYRHFLAHVALLDADSEPVSNSDSRRPIDLYPGRLGLSATNFSQVRAIARQLAFDLRTKDEEAKRIIRGFRLSLANEQTAGRPLPPPPPELIELQRQRDQLIENYVKLLITQLGPTDAARLDLFIEQQFAPKARVQRVAIPRSYNPAKNSLPPLERQAR